MWQIILGILLFIGGIANIGSSIGAFFTGIILGSLLMFFGLKKKGLISPARKKTKLAPPPIGSERTLKEENFDGAGVWHYESNIKKLANSNPDWKLTKKQIESAGKTGRKIFKNNYINKPVKLIPEPDNPHDSDAIVIVIAGEKVGYIRSDENVHVRAILDTREIKSISAFIGGGEYKILSEDGELIKGSYGFSVRIRIKYV